MKGVATRVDWESHINVNCCATLATTSSYHFAFIKATFTKTKS
jgi:hypothetical protein